MANFLQNFDQLFEKLQQIKNVEENLSKTIRFLEGEINFQSLGIFLKVPRSNIYRLKISRKISHHYAKTQIFEDDEKLISELKQFALIEYKEPEEKVKFEWNYSHLVINPLHNNKIFRGFIFLDKSAGEFSEDELLKIRLISKMISIIIDIDILRNEIAHSKNLDEITGFYTYSAFYERSEAQFTLMKRYNRPLTIVILKIDDYEKIVQTIGKEKTDLLIKSIAQTIKNNIRTSDIRGRLYRDLFGILMPETDTTKGLAAVKRMDELISQIPAMENRNIGWGLLEQSGRINNIDDFFASAREAAVESCRKSVYKYTVYQE
ncbi:MAG: hypothetical protein APR54_04010 [Candidatus Cloacimonas sp. SDB]|nr:MAG: hypothetical protein APR54_04010 [Candidatus Cloacimonas sp. SDB]